MSGRVRIILAAALLAWLAPPAAAEQAVVLGTIVDIHHGEAGNAFDLRLDDIEMEAEGLRLGEAIRVHYQADQIPARGETGIGDQIRATIAPVEGGEWRAAARLERVGRGELVRPGPKPMLDLGARDAKVLVKMMAPLGPECHRLTLRLLEDLVARESRRLRVQVFDMASAAGQEEMRFERLSCATVLVNNRYQFSLPESGGTRRVVLAQQPNYPRSSYRSEDVITIAEREIARLYPEPEKPETAPEPR